MHMADIGDLSLHYQIDGEPGGIPVVFANSLGTDFRLWDSVVSLLPKDVTILRFDKRGHGLSSCPGNSYTMDELVNDTAGLMDSLGFEKCLFVGLSIGGIIAQGLAASRPDLVRAMVISNTAAKIATPEVWQQRIDLALQGGVEALADATMERWFSKDFHQHRSGEMTGWRNMMTRTPLDGYVGCSRAIAVNDYTGSTAALSLPTLAIGGDEDGSTPPDVVKATAELIHGSRFELIEGAGHLPCVEKPQQYAELLSGFMRECF